MAYFVIGGKPDCPAFVHVAHVANYLETHLPHFKAHIIQKKTGKWEPWLEKINANNRWHHYRSPIIWKELSMRGGIAHYLGGISEFWEYCYDYYGLQSIIDPENLTKLVADNIQFCESLEKRSKEKLEDVRNIGIVGNHEMTHFFLSQLIQISELQKSGGLSIHLYDLYDSFDATKAKANFIAEDLCNLIKGKRLNKFEAVEKLQDLLTGCELLIVLGDYTRKKDEVEVDWLVRNMSAMYILADTINVYASRSLKIIIAIHGPVCFNVNVLIDSCTAIRIHNIVGVTSDLGLGVLQKAAEVTGTSLSDLGAPPVWGYIGINDFVDVKSTIMYSEMYRPYQRMLKNKGGSTLPLGILQPELRFMSYLLNTTNDICMEANERRKQIHQNLKRQPIYSKVRSTISLIKLWYSNEPTEDVISLSIRSNGTHGIPAGLVFSQPVILKNDVWVSFENFPIMEDTKKEIDKMIQGALLINESTNVGNANCRTSTTESV